MTTKQIGRTARVSKLARDENSVAVGEWYWLNREKTARDMDRVVDGVPQDLVCVVEVGSNHVKVSDVSGTERRVHFDEFDDYLTREHDAEAFIKAQVEEASSKVGALLESVRELTARLSLDAGTGHAQALAIRSTEPIKDYKTALVTAKTKTLPKLFEEIEQATKQVSMWMKASLVPVKANARRLRPIIETIESRIFNVELYAGLVETVTRIRDGEPAANDEPIRLMQRRAYMDEECLAEYKAGGMDFGSLGAFDRWMANDANFSRLLPFARCVIAMRVRRHDKERDAVSLFDFINMSALLDEDKQTFIYIRNGEQLYRLKTGIEFDEKLFPDIEHSVFDTDTPIYAKYFTGIEDELITEGEYQERRSAYINDQHDFGRFLDEKHASPEDEASVRARIAARRRKDVEREEAAHQPVYFGFYRYVKFDKRSTYYDDIAAVLAKQRERHNRLVMVLQGLLDRSLVFYPHPPTWKLWTPNGFASALRLVYDTDRVLVDGAAPDFEAYRRAVNETLSTASVCVGQEDYWTRLEAKRVNARIEASPYTRRRAMHYERYKPDGDPGPGTLAYPSKVLKGRVVFAWTRARTAYRRFSDNSPINRSIAVPRDEVFNVSGYRPGDFKRFFADPRTRANYLQWAPLLLEAEEYHAGNRHVEKKRGR